MINKQSIEQIKAKANLVDIISEYVNLKKRGKNYVGLCPFHSEKTGSFTVSPEKNLWHCFGCHEGGNLFGFIMKIENVDFVGAIETLASKLGIKLVYDIVKGKSRGEKEKIIKVNELALTYFKKQLGEKALKYLKQRGLNEEIIKTFELGYADDAWDNLYKYLISRGADPKLILASGLVIKKDVGDGYFDRFRGRIIFPIRDTNGKLRGFGGRVIDKGEPKYLNSPDTPVYNKSELLYGLNLAKDKIKSSKIAILVEGNLDLIACFQAGVDLTCATLGTALTPQHAKLLKRYAEKVIICFDADLAGSTAAQRSIDILREFDLSVKVCDLSPHKDPDEIIKKEGADAFKTRLKSAKPQIQYKLEALSTRYNLRDIEERAKAALEAAQIIGKEKNKILQSEYAKLAADFLAVDLNSLKSEIKKASFYRGKKDDGLNKQITLKPKSKIEEAEKIIIKLSLDNQAMLELAKETFSAEDFSHTAYQELFSALSTMSGSEKSIQEELYEKLENEDTKKAYSEIMVSEPIAAEMSQIFKDCANVISKNKLKNQVEQLKAKIREAEKSGKIDMVTKLHKEYSQVCKDLRETGVN